MRKEVQKTDNQRASEDILERHPGQVGMQAMQGGTDEVNALRPVKYKLAQLVDLLKVLRGKPLGLMKTLRAEKMEGTGRGFENEACEM